MSSTSIPTTGNITIDDFDPIILYETPGDWSTPNPELNPAWFNQTPAETGSQWHQATYHYTTTEGTKVYLNFTGTELFIWGDSGPNFGNFTVTLDPQLPSPYVYNGSAYAASNSTSRTLLYSSTSLSYSNHQAVIETTSSSAFLLDFVEVGGLEFGAEGATLTNTTYDDGDRTNLNYNGSWDTNENPLFWGGTSVYTSTAGDTITFELEGSAVYVYGDQVNDHGTFSIILDDQVLTSNTLSGRSGCDGQNRKYCEKLGGLHYFVGGIGEGTHNMTIVNDGNPETPYLDIDRITVTRPSSYSTRQLQTNLTCPFTQCNSTDTSGSPSGTATGSASGTAPSATQTGAASRRYGVPAIMQPLAYLDAMLSLQFWGLGAMAQEVSLPGMHEVVGSSDGHTNNWAVLVCTSRYWFNYRHMANTLGMYRTVKRLGIPDSQIILMLADDVSCNPRNDFPAAVYANSGRQLDLYGSGIDAKKTANDENGVQGVEGVEVDYRGYEVNVENFLRLLTGRYPDSLPASKRLLTDSSSNIFVYLTGHGGDEFLKFQDNEEVGAHDIGDAIGQMWEKKRYNRLFFMTDTCQANTLYSQIYSPNVLATGSSALGENSYSHHNDPDIGVAVIDSYTHHVLQYLEGIKIGSNATMQEFFDNYDPIKIKSHPGIFTDHFPFDLSSMLVTDFFGGVSQAEGMGKLASQTSEAYTNDLEELDVLVAPVQVDEHEIVQMKAKVLAARNRGYLISKRKSEDLEDKWKWAREWFAVAGLVGLGGMAWAAGK